MIKLIQEIIKLVIVICFSIGAFFVFKAAYKDLRGHEKIETKLSASAEILKNYLIKNKKPQRVEIVNLSKRFINEVGEIKKLKIAQDKKSSFYISIQFFTDESDEKAPLIAQVRFIEIKTGNTIKEESLNLD
jgi:hypothetical protein